MEILSLPTIQTIRRQHMWKPANLNASSANTTMPSSRVHTRRCILLFEEYMMFARRSSDNELLRRQSTSQTWLELSRFLKYTIGDMSIRVFILVDEYSLDLEIIFELHQQLINIFIAGFFAYPLTYLLHQRARNVGWVRRVLLDLAAPFELYQTYYMFLPPFIIISIQ